MKYYQYPITDRYSNVIYDGSFTDGIFIAIKQFININQLLLSINRLKILNYCNPPSPCTHPY